VLADKAYDADWIRNMIWEQGAVDVIPAKANRKQPAEFDAETCQERIKIERFFGRLKSSFLRIVPRYEKTSRNFPSRRIATLTRYTPKAPKSLGFLGF
jgi:transposase